VHHRQGVSLADYLTTYFFDIFFEEDLDVKRGWKGEPDPLPSEGGGKMDGREIEQGDLSRL
jgi:hypothetical protein